MNVGFISAHTWTVTITGTVLQRIPCWSTKCHYAMLKLVCGVLWVQLGLFGYLFCMRPYVHTGVLHGLTSFVNICPITGELFFKARQCCCSHRKQFSACTERFWGQHNNQGIVASFSIWTLAIDFYLWVILIREGCRNDPRTADDVKRNVDVQCRQFHHQNFVFVRCDTCLRSNWNYFQHLL
jgi:hypothetical protein